MDRQWIKNLATSRYDGQQWQLADPENPPFLAHTRLNDTMDSLWNKINDAVQIFNMHASAQKQLRLYKLNRGNQSPMCGFMILIANLQIKVERSGAVVASEAIYLQRVKSVVIPMRQFTARYDTFGEISWQMTDGIAMDLDRVARQILEDTCRLAYETGAIPHQDPANRPR